MKTFLTWQFLVGGLIGVVVGRRFIHKKEDRRWYDYVGHCACYLLIWLIVYAVAR